MLLESLSLPFNQYIMITEDLSRKIPLLSSKYYSDYDPREADELIRLAAQADPTPNHMYLDWIVRQNANHNISLPRDIESIRSILIKYNRLKNRGLVNKDIHKYKSYDDLADAVSSHNIGLVDDEGKIKAVQGAIQVVEEDPYTIYRLDDYDAARELCNNTQWCVKSRGNFDEYISHGPIYLVYKDGKKYSLVHYETGEFEDPHGKSIPASEIFKIIGILEPATGIGIDNHPELALLYMKHTSSHNDSLENVVAKDPNTAVKYAQYIRGPFPKAEPVIAKDPMAAAEYSRIVGEFKEGEDAIKRDPRAIYIYSTTTGKRLEDVEDVLLDTPALAINYANEVGINKWPELENKLIELGNPRLLIRYATEILKRPWPRAHRIIGPFWNQYARDMRNLGYSVSA